MELDRGGLRSIAQLSDDIGVLSIYASRDAHEPDTNQPVVEAQIRGELEALLGEVQRAAPREHVRALAQRVDTLRLELESLLTMSGGVGRALFARVADGDMLSVVLQRPLVNHVAFEPKAYLRPLVAASSHDGPAGVAVVSADGVRLIDMRYGSAVETANFPYTAPSSSRELRGPAATTPGMAQQSVRLTDVYERRERDRVLRFLSTIAGRVPEVAAAKEWGYLAVTGDGELVASVVSGLPTVWPVTVIRLPYVLGAARPHEVAATVRSDLAGARLVRGERTAVQVRDTALAGGPGSLGLGETLAALQQGRVAHLLLDDSRAWPGSRAPDGYLVSEGETPPWVDGSRLATERDLAERMISSALDTGAEVTLLEPAAATPLGDSDGIGAQLRW